jgi:hypothetical protein
MDDLLEQILSTSLVGTAEEKKKFFWFSFRLLIGGLYKI